MRPESQTDHIALLALRIRVGGATGPRLHRLVKAVRTPGEGRNLTDLGSLFGNINIGWKHSSLRDQQA